MNEMEIWHYVAPTVPLRGRAEGQANELFSPASTLHENLFFILWAQTIFSILKP